MRSFLVLWSLALGGLGQHTPNIACLVSDDPMERAQVCGSRCRHDSPNFSRDTACGSTLDNACPASISVDWTREINRCYRAETVLENGSFRSIFIRTTHTHQSWESDGGKFLVGYTGYRSLGIIASNSLQCGVVPRTPIVFTRVPCAGEAAPPGRVSCVRGDDVLGQRQACSSSCLGLVPFGSREPCGSTVQNACLAAVSTAPPVPFQTNNPWGAFINRCYYVQRTHSDGSTRSTFIRTTADHDLTAGKFRAGLQASINLGITPDVQGAGCGLATFTSIDVTRVLCHGETPPPTTRAPTTTTTTPTTTTTTRTTTTTTPTTTTTTRTTTTTTRTTTTTTPTTTTTTPTTTTTTRTTTTTTPTTTTTTRTTTTTTPTTTTTTPTTTTTTPTTTTTTEATTTTTPGCDIPIDIHILQHASGSMMPNFRRVANLMLPRLQSVLNLHPRSTVSLSMYRDKPVPTLGEESDYCILPRALRSVNMDDLMQIYTTEVVGGGFDVPDNQFGALVEVLQSPTTIPWMTNTEAVKLVILVTNEVPHFEGDGARQMFPQLKFWDSFDEIRAEEYCRDYYYPSPDQVRDAVIHSGAKLATVVIQGGAFAAYDWFNGHIGQNSEWITHLTDNLPAWIDRLVNLIEQDRCGK